MIARLTAFAACGVVIGVWLTARGGGSSGASGPTVGDCVTLNASTLAEDVVSCSSRSAEDRVVAVVDKQSQCNGTDSATDSIGKTMCLVEAHLPPLRVKVGDCVDVFRHAEKVPCEDGADRLLAIVKNHADCPAKANGSATDADGRVFCVHTIGT